MRLGVVTQVIFSCCILVLSGCTVSNVEHKTVEVMGSGSAEDKLALAKSVAPKIWNNEVIPEIRESLPEIKKEDFVEHMSLSWGATEFTSYTDEKNNRTVVFLRCTTSHPDSVYVSTFLEICANAINTQLKEHVSSDG